MRRYLTGIDWVINSIDYAGKAKSGIGNVSQVVLELRGEIDGKVLIGELSGFLQNFPLINGLPARAWNLCPYWKVFPRSKMLLPRIQVTGFDKDADASAFLEARVNEPFANKREHLVFNLVQAGKKSFLSMVFDHRILDARGAEAFLDLFQSWHQKEALPQIVLDEPPHLDRWKEKFIAGRQVNRMFLNLIRKKSPRTLPQAPGRGLCRFKAISFDPERAARITEAAYGRAGYLMLMPYALAKSAQIMHRVFEARNIPGSTYLIPVSIDGRAQEQTRRDIFFNHVSFFLFEIEADIINDLGLVLARVKEQMYEQVKSGFPAALKNASFLLRIAPLPMTNFFLQCLAKKQFASFSFSFVGSAYNARAFMGEEVRNISHLPRVPNPPGVGIFFNQFNDRINAALSYYDGLLTGDDAERIASALNAVGDDG